jgi:hypothetical protein
MQVVISNKSKLSNFPNQITVSNVNKVGRVTFGKIAKLGSVGLQNLNNVVISGQQDGDVLVYQANTNTYNIKTLPNIDGGTF